MTDCKIRIAVTGAAGQMGAAVCAAVLGAEDLDLVALVDPAFAGGREGAALPRETAPADVPRFGDLDTALGAVTADVTVDFTNVEGARANLRTCLDRRVAAVVGTTGLPAPELENLGREAAAARVPVLIAPNFALGAVLMMRFAGEAAAVLDACEVVELHHDRKLDAPSGTARRTGDLVEHVWRTRGLAGSVPIHSVRRPGLVAHQEVIFGGLGQTLTIRHDSLSRESFMPGVLLAIRRVLGMEGLVIGLENIL